MTPSYTASSDELSQIALGLKDAGGGVLQFVSNFDDIDVEFGIARRMVEESGRPLSLSLIQFSRIPDRWRAILDRIEAANNEGLTIKAQVSGRPIGLLNGFRLGHNPFRYTAAFREIASLAPDARLAALRDPERRARILREFPGDLPKGKAAVPFDFGFMYDFEGPHGYEPTVEESMLARAAAAGVSPAAYT